METNRMIEVAAHSINLWLMSDSSIQVSPRALVKALIKDHEGNGGVVPTEEECMLLVTGDDEGDVPEEVRGLFPNTNDFLASQF